MTIKIICPTCRQSLIWSTENTFRPFCSERCKLIDLGAWASENHRIAGESIDEQNASAGSNEENS